MRKSAGLHGAFRQSMAWLHTWSGLVFSILLYFIFVMGTFGYFTYEIDRWMKPELSSPSEFPTNESMLVSAISYLDAETENTRRYFIGLPTVRSNPSVSAFANYNEPNEEGDRFFRETLDPVSGAPVGARDTNGGRGLYEMHYALHYMPYEVAYYTVGVATLFMFLAIITGIVTHKKIFVDFFTLRLGKGQRSWLDSHNMTSVLALPFMLMITYSGLLFFLIQYSPGTMFLTLGLDREAVSQLNSHRNPVPEIREPTGAAAASADIRDMMAYVQQQWPDDLIRGVEILNPGEEGSVIRIDAVNDGISRESSRKSIHFDAAGQVLTPSLQRPADAKFLRGTLALHEGRFANYWLRWTYFLSGLLGCSMIATGLLLWAKKRRTQLKKGMEAPRTLVFIERTNLAIIVGLPLGVATYFWANRLLPLDIPERAAWELDMLFIVWGLSFIHAGARELRRAWREQVAFLAALCLLLPVVNALTSEAHLGNSLAAGDWARAGFDLTAIVFGLVLCGVWPKLVTPNANPARGLENLVHTSAGISAQPLTPQSRKISL